MPNRSIRDEQQGVARNRVQPSDPEQVRAALRGSSSKTSTPSTSSTPAPAVRADRPAVRGQTRININQGQQVRAQMDDNLSKIERGD